MLVRERRTFAQVKLPYDCRELLRFIREMREYDMVAKLDYADEEDFIRRGLELDPQTVLEALAMLERIKPEWAIPFREAAAIGRVLRDGPGKPTKSERLFSDEWPVALGKVGNSLNTGITIGKRDTAAYIRARLERDSRSEKLPTPIRDHRASLLAKVTGGEMSAHAAGVEAGYRAHMIQHPATVDGFARAIKKHLTDADRLQLAERLREAE